MQEKSEVCELQRRQGSRILLWAAVLLLALGFGIPAAPQRLPNSQIKLPVSPEQWPPAQNQASLTEELKSFKRGIDYYLEDRCLLALDALPDEQKARESVFGDYILLYRARCYLKLERYREALQSFRFLESLYPNTPLKKEALIGQCQALLQLNDPKAALALLRGTQMDTDSETLYYQARALDEAGEKNKAAELYLQVYSKYPGSKSSPLAERYLLEMSPSALRGRNNYGARLQRAENLIKAGDARQTRTLLLALGRVAAPDSPSAEKRNLLQAEVENRIGKATTGLLYLAKITAADPAIKARAMYLEGAFNRKLDREEAFLKVRDDALKRYPQSPDTEELCYSAATYFDVNYEPAKSRKAYQILYEAFPKGRHAERAHWKLALYSYFEKNYPEAALEFWNYLLEYPNPLAASSALYWMGRCYDKLDDPVRAEYLFNRSRSLANNSFYGQLAREATGSLYRSGAREANPVPAIDFSQVAATCDKIQLPPISLPELEEGSGRVVARARALLIAGLADNAIAELRWGIRSSPKDEDTFFYLMARIYESRGDHNGAIACLRRAFPDYNLRTPESLPGEVWQVLFPVKHWGVITAQAAKTNIDPTLVLGVIRQESGFEEDALSKAKARGLMQILPSTGRKLARKSDIKRYSAKRLYQADTNIILGTRYLAALLRQYGKEELALAAYNAGDTRVDRWMQEFGKTDTAEFVEQIPFAETRGYVKQVFTNKAHYGVLTSTAR